MMRQTYLLKATNLSSIGISGILRREIVMHTPISKGEAICYGIGVITTYIFLRGTASTGA